MPPELVKLASSVHKILNRNDWSYCTQSSNYLPYHTRTNMVMCAAFVLLKCFWTYVSSQSEVCWYLANAYIRLSFHIRQDVDFVSMSMNMNITAGTRCTWPISRKQLFTRRILCVTNEFYSAIVQHIPLRRMTNFQNVDSTFSACHKSRR